MQPEAVVTTVKGEAIRTSDVIVHMKLKGIFRTSIYELIEQKVLKLQFKELGLILDEEDVEKRAKSCKISLGIDILLYL